MTVLCRSVMKILLFQVCSLLLIHKAETAGCLLKHGFGLAEGYAPTLVDEPSHFSINIIDCEKKCEKEVVKKV